MGHRPTTMRQRQSPGTMLMLNSTDFDDFWPLHVHRALLDNDSRIRNHHYSRGTRVPSLATVALTRAVSLSPAPAAGPLWSASLNEPIMYH